MYVRKDERLSSDKIMTSVVVVGTQWGDEGKGKITDFLSANAEVITVIRVVTMPAIPL